MLNWTEKILGVISAAILLGFGNLPKFGACFYLLPLLITVPMRVYRPSFTMAFLLAYSLAALVEGLFFYSHLKIGIFLELPILFLLVFVLDGIQSRSTKVKSRLSIRIHESQKSFENFKDHAKELEATNSKIEKQLRQIEHLYDVIKEAGSSMNVQEMIELAKESIERMFDLPHFVIAVLSDDGKKYEIRISSGCEDLFFRNFFIDINSSHLAAVLAKDKQPIWFDTIDSNVRFEKLKSLPIRSFLFLPLLMQDRVIGFICSYSFSEKFLDLETFSNFQIFCSQISIGLQKSLLYEKVQKLSITDGLTKLYSHRHFKQRLEEELILANRYTSQLSLLILDIDHFKHYNDHYGHVAGDHVLMEVATILKRQSDVMHLVARYGGEEMVVVAPETNKEQAMGLAEKIRKAVETHDFAVGKEITQVTVSIGVATYPYDAKTNMELIGKADKALYSAKSNGRNRVVSYLAGSKED